ncbi:MAG: hypothetical protein K2G24_05400 [Muribaculaceae bacterium]|nr:hypothetical protein [Muribaculaceae bacterium]
MKLFLKHITAISLLLAAGAGSLRAQEPADDMTPDVTDPFELATAGADSLLSVPPEYADTAAVTLKKEVDYDRWEERETQFNPDPTRAVWMAALFPGLGQLYNRRYWKLPVVVGAYVGLGYATSWNNSMLRDYTRAYRDITDNDDSTRSYMDFFPPTTKEEDLDRTWLTNIMRARKDFYRRNRDLCIISMVGVYLLAMVDAYVDASLSHFDITPDLAIDLSPQLMLNDPRISKPALGLMWALTF